MQLCINNLNTPRHIIKFLDLDEYNKLESNKAIEKTRHWHALIEVLIRKADEEDLKVEKAQTAQTSSSGNGSKSGNGSVADEIKKLNELYKQGVISEREFIEQKKKLLS